MNRTHRRGAAVHRAVMVASLAVLVGCGSAARSDAAGPTSAAALAPTASSAATSAAPTATRGLVNAQPPSGRSQFAAAYDPVTRSVIIEGGLASSGKAGPPPVTVAETLSWDGHRWQRLADGPALANGSLTVDPASGHLLLIGGDHQLPGQPYAPQGGMWAWDGQRWSRVGDNPAETGVSQAATDPVHRQVLINATGPTGGGECTPPACQSPAPYQQYGRYQWTSGAWRIAPPNFMNSYGASHAAMGFDPISKQVIQQGANAQGGDDSTLAWNGTYWRLLRGPSTTGQSGPTTGYAASDGHMLLMLAESRGTDQSLASTWSFNGSTWQRHVVTAPPAGSQLVYDPAIGSFIAIGARHFDQPLSVWQLTNLSDGWRELPASV